MPSIGATTRDTTTQGGRRADVELRPDPAGGFQISGIALTVRGEVEGLDAAGFEKAAQDAKATCPVSKALTGTAISLDAALA